MKWFKHDSCANMDAKLQEVLLDYGLEGYGLYWYCIELISSKVSKDNITFYLEHDSRIIARNTGSTVQKVQEMMNRFIELGLFESQNGFITCYKLAKRLDQSMTSNADMRQVIGLLKSQNHDSIMTESRKVMQEENRLEENRLEETKDKKDDSTDEPPKFNFKKELINLGIDKKVVSDWLKVRSKKKASNTETALKAIIKQIKKSGLAPNEAIKLSVENSWSGFKAEWIKNQAPSQKHTLENQNYRSGRF